MLLSPSPLTLFITCLATAGEAFIGYPDLLFRLIGHPVTWVGALISLLEERLNRADWSESRRRRAGFLALLLIISISFALSCLLLHLADLLFDPATALTIEVFAISAMIAQRSLWNHVRAVRDTLDQQDITRARQVVSMIVGRDTSSLDEAAIIRAAIESLAENFSDGVVAPIFWSILGGFPGAMIYKAVNTADSMIGHLTPRFSDFGRASARCDDFLNLPASRLSAFWIVLAAMTLRRANARRAISTVMRDARKHRSPNAGWPEAAMAGALGLRLAGPKSYDGVEVADPWIGSGHARATNDDLTLALSLYRRACVIQWLVLTFLALRLMHWIS